MTYKALAGLSPARAFVLKDALQEQQQSHDRQWNANDGSDHRQADDDTHDHEYNAKDHGDEPPGQFDDHSQQLPDRGERPQIPGDMMFCMCTHLYLRHIQIYAHSALK